MKDLPKQPFENLAISMSGGGYRATSFHLGSLSYLSKVRWGGKSLADRLRIISSVSGGTFMAVHYSVCLKHGKSVLECYSDLYRLMSKVDLIGEALKKLADDSNWNGSKERSLINACALVYHETIAPDYFALLFQEEPKIHLKEMVFNATEFNFALPFRHQKTELTRGKNDEPAYGIYGNYHVQIPQECAKEMRLSDIIASSSCFPLGFEPINFPHDFIDENSRHLNNPDLLPKTNPSGVPISYPVGLMDGGIDDNQGIGSVMEAETRMSKYTGEQKAYASQDDRAVDLYIISDVSSLTMDSFIRTEEMNIPVIGKWSFRTLKTIGWILFILGLSAYTGSVYLTAKAGIDMAILSIGLASFGTLAVLVAFLLRKISKGFEGLTTAVGVPKFFTDRLWPLDTLKFNVYGNLIMNRGKSAMTMVSDVFMKQIRRLNYNKIYSDEAWRPRLIMNAVYELSPDEVIQRKQKYGVEEPSEAIQNVAERARTMGTTLWFTPEQLEGKNNMLDALIACGQFTMCYNLMDYISRIMKRDNKVSYANYSPELKAQIDELYLYLEADWDKFSLNPYWMVEEWNENMANGKS